MIRNVEVIKSSTIRSLADLKRVIAAIEDETGDHPDTIYIRADIALEEETLSDGSIVHNVTINERL